MARALISVSDKTGLVEFARRLIALGFELVSTGGTATALERAGVSVIGVAAVTGFPEMMDGRVKTLHPMVHGGILARRSRPDDLTAIANHGITLIDLVVVNLYPFAAAAAKPDTPVDGLIEEIDIGGPSLIRAAAKNFQDVLVVVSPSQYRAVLDELERPGGPSRAFRLGLARTAFTHISDYDEAIASALSTVSAAESGFRRETTTTDGPALADRSGELPSSLTIGLRKVRDLRYGENPHQQAALYEAFGIHPGFRVLQGKDLSYTNLLDLDAAIRIVVSFTEPSAAIIKHMNPCGAATGSSAAEAYVRARDADSLSAFGAIVGLNRPVDVETARAIVSTRIDGVIAPSIDAAALEILAGKPKMRVVVPERLIADGDYRPEEDLELRSIVGGVLVQRADRVTEASTAWPSGDLRIVTKRQPTAAEWKALRFAWLICANVKSNSVIFTTSDRTLSIGAGQMSRVDAVKVARMKADAAGLDLKGSVAASDAFFPFRDGLDAVAAAGATAIVQPGGALRDTEIVSAADEHGLAMVFTRRRHFRH